MCGVPQTGKALTDLNTTDETVIQGAVTASGEPVPSAYVRLLDSAGEFTAEVVSSAEGRFRFFAAPGHWTLRALSTRGIGEVSVAARQGINESNVPLAQAGGVGGLPRISPLADDSAPVANDPPTPTALATG